MESTQHSSTTPSPSLRNQRNNSGRKLQRQRSRLQMHAPASITISPVEAASISNWQVPIPLLSPLDVSPVHGVGMPEKDYKSPVSETDTAAAATDTAASAVASSGAMWRHPAEPFYCEPLPGYTPGFAFSNCT